MADATDLLAVVEQAASAFRREGITYFITGSLASSVHGEFRATNDLDLVADVDAKRLRSLLDRLGGDFLVDLDAAKAAVDSRTSFNVIHRQTFLKVDVFPCVTSFDREAARRAETILMPGGSEPLRVATKEDIVLAKLRWYRLGGEQSEVQRRDIRHLLALNRGSFEWEYLERWAESLGVRELLTRFADEAA